MEEDLEAALRLVEIEKSGKNPPYKMLFFQGNI